MTSKELSEILIMASANAMRIFIKKSYKVYGEPAEAATAGFCSNFFPGSMFGIIQN